MENVIKKRIAGLPVKAEDLAEYILVGRQVLKAQKAKLAAIQAVEKGLAACQAALNDTQDLAEILLYAEARLGEMLTKDNRSTGKRTSVGTFAGRETLPDSIDKRQSHEAQELARHQDTIAQVVAKAREGGEVPVRQHVLREIRLTQIRDKPATPPLPPGVFRTVIIDPPWPVQKIEREVRPNQGRDLDYTTLSLEEIMALPVREKCDNNGCHVYLWVTHKYLPYGIELFKAWGIAYQCLLTWVKNVGITPFSWMYSTEHILFGHIGSLPLLQKGLRLDFNAKVTRHSEKPDVFFDLVRKASPGPRLIWFGRKAHADFVNYGLEAE